MNDLIYNQRQIPKEQWRYGLRSSAATGCGWIATYNALRLLGYKSEPEELIRYYERQLPLLHGNAGTSVLGPAVCMKQLGFPTRVIARRSEFDQAAKKAQVCILYYHWRRSWRMGAHFVALQYKNGSFVGYNTYRHSSGPDEYGESLEAFLKQKKYYGAVLAVIDDRRGEKK